MGDYVTIFIDKNQQVIFLSYDSDFLEMKEVENFKTDLEDAYNFKVLVGPNINIEVI